VRQRSFILVAVFVFLLLAGAVGAYAYDSSRDDLIAEGVTVAGVDVGGLRPSQAGRVLEREVSEPLNRPIVIRRAGKRFTLSAEDAGSRADVEAMVRDALAATRHGNVVTRVVRDLTGGEENARLPARVSYSEAAVTDLVRRVKKGLNRPARDADVAFPAMTPIKEKKGLEVKGGVRRRRIVQALEVPSVDRTLRAPAKVLKPKVTVAELEDKYPLVLVVNRAWSVPNSDWAGDLAGTVVPGGVPENPLKARWLGIFNGAGIHGTDAVYSLGSAASHGCIRMSIPDVIELYDQVPVGAPIYIA